MAAAQRSPDPAGSAGAALHAAAFHGPPGAVDAVLAAVPAAGLAARERWLAAVCLGALGRYGEAAGLLLPGGRPAGSLAASARASHLRQLSRHAEAEVLDRQALATAGADAEARADALVGLVADAVGQGDRPLAGRRLARAAREIAAPAPAPPTGTAAGRGPGTAAGTASGAAPGWRAEVRLAWVRTEVSLLGDQPGAAVRSAAAALDLARAADAPRHAAKSLLMLAAANEVVGGASAAIPLLRQAVAAAEALGLVPLVWPGRLLLARLLDGSDPVAAEHERRAAASAICVIRGGLPAAETATLLARPEIRPLVG